jgi:glycosyltransferase involved in cell wall biosynthesis
MRVSIVIPAYNEEKRLPPMLKGYAAYFEQLRKHENIDYELLVVINKSTDRTLDVVKSMQRIYPKIRYLDLPEKGKGLAIIAGFKDALKRPNELIGFADADMATPPEAFYDLVRHIDPYDGVIAARWRKESVVTRQTTFFRVKSSIFNLIVRALFLFPYSDTQCGAKLFTRKAVEHMHDKLGITRWAFDIDLLYKLRTAGFSVIEIPTVWESKDDSRIKLISASIEMLLAVVRLRLVHSPLAFMVKAYDRLPQQLKMHHRIWIQ